EHDAVAVAVDRVGSDVAGGDVGGQVLVGVAVDVELVGVHGQGVVARRVLEVVADDVGDGGGDVVLGVVPDVEGVVALDVRAGDVGGEAVDGPVIRADVNIGAVVRAVERQVVDVDDGVVGRVLPVDAGAVAVGLAAGLVG